jgi:hypothetical protein
VTAVALPSRPLTAARTAAQLAAYAHVLREAVHLSCSRIAVEPQLEVKLLLADHVYDDARAVRKLCARTAELGHPGSGPGPELSALLDRGAVYEELKPALADALREHRERLDPLADEPSLRLLTQLQHRQERHLVELGPSPLPDPRRLPADSGEERTPAMRPLAAAPARDGFVIVTPEHRPTDPAQELHALMNAELCTAELAAQTSHEYPEMAWDFRVDMARQAADCARHVAALDRLLGERGAHWGDQPVSLAAFQERYARDLAGRLAPREHPRQVDDPLFDYVAADWAAHERANARWR